ncbi:threonine aldolase family protein [Elongatibacter sediminis]|uniref:GntG family PLP-dependent aldolase n=1 Tax=Elongatibacter sediminis TaxID=3119006 RepID=A0AAW9REV7_9GAMM
MNTFIDLRSDTFTRPTAGMRQAIAAADVGNAGYGEDPSVNRLEGEIAEYFGQESAVFLPSATMAGQVAIAVWTRPGDTVLIEQYGHDYYFETGAMAAVAGAQAHLLAGHRGVLDPDDVAAALIHPENPYARTALVVLENTSNYGGGTVYPQTTLERIFTLTRDRAIPVHVDGARIWNAIIATGADPGGLVQAGGSLSVCLSKGLGAPMGALLLGETAFIAEARRVQFMLGGVMRQVGFMAEAARYAFRHHFERLADDHANASLLAEQLAGNPHIHIDHEAVQTNMVYLDMRGGAEQAANLVRDLDAHGIGALAVGHRVRLVTSLNVDRTDCEQAAATINRLLEDT